MTARLDRLVLSTAMLIAGGAGLAGCEVRETDEAEPAENQSTLNLPALPRPQPPMDRETLLAAIARAASAAAAGADDSSDQGELQDSRFEISVRFGCRGRVEQIGDAILGWTFNAGNRTLRVRATPTIGRDNDIVAHIVGQADGQQIEAVEGFWIPRPWLLDPVCPQGLPAREQAPPESGSDDGPGAAQAPAVDEQESQAPPPALPKVGIAHFFLETEPRTRRRAMRPYDVVKTLAANQKPSAQGYNLVLSGRLRALPGRRVIACVFRGADAPPDCVVSVAFDRVRIERPEPREVLAEWGFG